MSGPSEPRSHHHLRVHADDGPRVSMARQSKIKDIHFFALEDQADYYLLGNAKFVLEPLNGLIVIDEIQRRSELFKYLRVKVDSLDKKSKILILGSSSRDLIENASESRKAGLQSVTFVAKSRYGASE